MGFAFQFQNNKLVLDTHTIEVSCLFFHFRDLQKQSPDFTSELEWDSFVNSPMKLIERNKLKVINDKNLRLIPQIKLINMCQSFIFKVSMLTGTFCHGTLGSDRVYFPNPSRETQEGRVHEENVKYAEYMSSSIPLPRSSPCSMKA